MTRRGNSFTEFSNLAKQGFRPHMPAFSQELEELAQELDPFREDSIHDKVRRQWRGLSIAPDGYSRVDPMPESETSSNLPLVGYAGRAQSLQRIEQHERDCSERERHSSDSDSCDELRPATDFRSKMKKVVDSSSWSYVVTTAVVLNAILIGVETDFEAQTGGKGQMPGSDVCGHVFCTIFTAEVATRVFALGLNQFFLGSDWRWNIFDFLVVGMQWVEIASKILVGGANGVNLGFLRMLRLLRIARIMRLARILRLVVELRTMITAILGSLKPFFWTMIILFMVIYSVAVAMTQMVNDHRANHLDDTIRSERSKLEIHFGSLTKVVFGLWESISGGIDWHEMVLPLIEEISPGMGVVFSGFIAFSTLALMNVITGIFVESACTYAQVDKDTYVVRHVLSLFKRSDLNKKHHITWSMMQSQLNDKELQELFKAVDVDIKDAESLFKLIDTHGTGRVSPDAFFRAWVRLRGPAKSIDLSLLIRETTRAHETIQGQLSSLTEAVDWMMQVLDDEFGSKHPFQGDACDPATREIGGTVYQSVPSCL